MAEVTFEMMKAKVKETMEAPSCCPELKAACDAFLKSIGTPDQIESEKERIAGAKSGLVINPIHLDEDLTLVDAITAIDGAVLMDTDCVCGCIGAILDGDLVTKGALARGSRYNSARNYIMRRCEFDEHFLAVVMSEDGTVDAINEDKVYRLHMAQD